MPLTRATTRPPVFVANIPQNMRCRPYVESPTRSRGPRSPSRSWSCASDFPSTEPQPSVSYELSHFTATRPNFSFADCHDLQLSTSSSAPFRRVLRQVQPVQRAPLEPWEWGSELPQG